MTHAHRRVTTAVLMGVLLAPLLALVAAGSASAAPRTTDTGWVRAGHLAPGTPKADIELTRFGGGDPVTLDGVAYSSLTGYERLPVGLYTVALRAAGSDESVAPMLSANVRVTADAAITVVAAGEGADLAVRTVYDDLRAPAQGNAKVRLVSAAGSEPVSAEVQGGPVLARDVTSGSATGYAEVPAQTWQVEVARGEDETVVNSVPLEAGSTYTLLVVDDSSGDLRLEAVQDSAGAGVMPTGGVDTGAGGLVDASGGRSAVTYPVVLPAALVLLLAAGVLGRHHVLGRR